jgi:PiT family inorganic phosphate transporter
MEGWLTIAARFAQPAPEMTSSERRESNQFEETIMELFGESLTFAAGFFLLLALALALAFEFVNGFHDTANAVATVIYTNTLKPVFAVIWSGIWNLLGAVGIVGAFYALIGWGGINSAVAYKIVALLPQDLVIHSGSGAGFAMIFALLISAIIWNVGTWYLGLPASSSHTLIGSIMGVGVADALMSGQSWTVGVNWDQAITIGLALLLSPVVGFLGAGALLLILKATVHREDLFQAPEGKNPPPLWIRCVLILTCTLVSVFHGSNDAQKGMGLIMLILIGVVPGAFALNAAVDPKVLSSVSADMALVSTVFTPLGKGATVTKDDAETELTNYLKQGGTPASDKTWASVGVISQSVSTGMAGMTDFSKLNGDQRQALRTDIYLVGETIGKVVKGNKLVTDKNQVATLKKSKGDVEKITKYIPIWVKIMVACALGFGTMIGWKRIVVTVGEKIGKSHLTYAQGASAELMAAATIGLADGLGLPVSTTHVLSSGIAGTMAANRSGLQKETLISILMAWVLTLPVCIFLGATLFSAALYVTFHVFGIK